MRRFGLAYPIVLIAVPVAAAAAYAARARTLGQALRRPLRVASQSCP